MKHKLRTPRTSISKRSSAYISASALVSSDKALTYVFAVSRTLVIGSTKNRGLVYVVYVHKVSIKQNKELEQKILEFKRVGLSQ